jgi:hypothetical protein
MGGEVTNTDQLRATVDAAICDLMTEHGPDGHIDGHEEIVNYLMAMLEASVRTAVEPLAAELEALRSRPSPLLQCVDCRNTESPAGAMARYFNQGRCLHCGGWFKVVRA